MALRCLGPYSTDTTLVMSRPLADRKKRVQRMARSNYGLVRVEATKPAATQLSLFGLHETALVISECIPIFNPRLHDFVIVCVWWITESDLLSSRKRPGGPEQ